MKPERTRRPTTPGEVLLEEFLKPAKVTQTDFARHLGCDVKTVNRLIKGHTSLDVDMARRIAAALGTSPEFWIRLQNAVDLFDATRSGTELPPTMEPFRRSAEI
jgi:antitoxin HigA-1